MLLAVLAVLAGPVVVTTVGDARVETCQTAAAVGRACDAVGLVLVVEVMVRWRRAYATCGVVAVIVVAL